MASARICGPYELWRLTTSTTNTSRLGERRAFRFALGSVGEFMVHRVQGAATRAEAKAVRNA